MDFIFRVKEQVEQVTNTFLPNISKLPSDCTISHPRRYELLIVTAVRTSKLINTQIPHSALSVNVVSYYGTISMPRLHIILC
jgi:hypothetical protein